MASRYLEDTLKGMLLMGDTFSRAAYERALPIFG
jgi:hypothetical protein